MIVTHPGKFGDLLWALPTVRAIAASYGPVDLQLSSAYGTEAFMDLLIAQPYIGSVRARRDWQIQQTAPITPYYPPISDADYRTPGAMIHLGYRSWPAPTLPQAVYDQVNQTLRSWELHELGPLDLDTPWIQAKPLGEDDAAWATMVYAWTDEWFELKQGLTVLLMKREQVVRPWQERATILTRHDSRWDIEGIGGWGQIHPTNWVQAARVLQPAKTIVADCSALHVLALALGKNVHLVEPNPQRHHSVFYPYGMDGPRVTVVRGNDGLPTFDARHVREALDA